MKGIFASQRFFAMYSGVLTLALVVSILSGFAKQNGTAHFKEITVQRINIVEPDGTLRMVISDKALFPGAFLRGKEVPHPNRKTTGMLFLNEEGTENGGLIFGGEKDKSGKTSSYGHLSFDAYEQDQLFTVESEQEGNKYDSSLVLADEPDYPIGELFALTDKIKNLPPEQQKLEIAKFQQSHAAPHQRVFLGRADDKSVAMRLKDMNGQDRMILQVDAAGSPTIRFLDASGKVISELPPAKAQ